MLLAGLIKCSLIDFPGRVAATVFTQGCNLRCSFCHNQSLISMRPPVSGHSIQIDAFFRFLQERKDLLEGVCVTGGEPTQHLDLARFLTQIKGQGYLVKLDTNGTRPQVLADLVEKGLVDYFAMDVKHRLDTEHYASGCGKPLPLDHICESIAYICESGVPYEFRTTVVPGLHVKADLEAIGRSLEGVDRYALQHFRPSPGLPDSLNQRAGEVPLLIESARPQIEEWVGELVVR